MDKKPKPAWLKPELIVIVRGRPEEAVLAGCKVNIASSTGSGGWNRCRRGQANCDAILLS